MVLNTLSVSVAVTPTIIKTTTNHYTDRKSRRQKPTAHITYDSGLNLIRRFLDHAAHNTVEDLQAFTSQWVPTPRWIRCEQVDIPERTITKAAKVLKKHLGHKGIAHIGGGSWWQWRREGTKLSAEWIEMRADYNARKKAGKSANRVMLYVHGGAYFFGSVDEHRYQIQRHARKLKARVFSPRYRLAPQYPFPCGLHDCLASYLFLIEIQDPTTIILAGDSAGGGMILSMMVILRDLGLLLPAGAVLISPWCDLTHSFPSVSAHTKFDYIPPHGFMARPSAAWPPPTEDDMEELAAQAVGKFAKADIPRRSGHHERKAAAEAASRGFSVEIDPNLRSYQDEHTPTGTENSGGRGDNTIPGPGHNLSIEIDGKLIEIKDQIQMYTTNQLISHPLVSPVLQPSLGGLPPLLILTGGGEVLRDEQIYVAHKAADPTGYPPGDKYLDEEEGARETVGKYPPTDVQLQVWDDLCHVAPTLSFTRPAKYMYRSVAQFGAWALARAQNAEIDILDDDDVSVISSETQSSSNEELEPQKARSTNTGEDRETKSNREMPADVVGKAGDPLPPFRKHMIRQRVDRNGNIFPLDPPTTLPALQISPNEVGVIKPGPVSKWMAAKKEWESKYANEKRQIQRNRVKEMVKGYQGFGDDDAPPPSALAGRRGLKLPKERKISKSLGLSLWSLWGSSHDKSTIEREERAEKHPDITVVDENGINRHRGPRRNSSRSQSPLNASRERSQQRTTKDVYQIQEGSEGGENTNSADDSAKGRDGAETTSSAVRAPIDPNQASLSIPSPSKQPQFLQVPGTNVTIDRETDNRPKAGGVAFPFSLSRDAAGREINASMVTLHSVDMVPTPRMLETNGGPDNENGNQGILGGLLASATTMVKSVQGQQEGEREPQETSIVDTNENESTKPLRPTVERFETAQETL